MAAAPSLRRASLVEPAPVAPEAVAAHALYERHAARIHGYCLHRLGSREEAEDALQTTFMNAFRALQAGVKPDSEAAWLFKIAENVCLSRHRSSFRRGRVERPADLAALEAFVPGPGRHWDELIGLDDALDSLPEQQRRAILLREWHGLSYREIAERLQVSQAAVETLIFRARRSLARGLTDPQATGRRGLRRVRRLGDLASLLVGAKALFGGVTAAQAAVAAVAVTAVVGATATPVPQVVTPPPAPPKVVTPPAAAPPAGALAGAAARGRLTPSAPSGGASAATAPRVVTPQPAAALPPERPAAPAAPAAAERDGPAPGTSPVAQARSGGRSGGTASADRPAPPASPAQAAVPARPPAAPPRTQSPRLGRSAVAPARGAPNAARAAQPQRSASAAPVPHRPEPIPDPAAAAAPIDLPPAAAEKPGGRPARP